MDVNAFREFYEFDDDDLYANQQGRLSDKQYQTLSSQAVQMKGYAKIGSVVAFVVAAIMPCILLPISLLTVLTQDWRSTFIALGGALVWLAVFGGAGVWLLRASRASGNRHWDVTRAEGVAHLEKMRVSSGGGRSYTVTMVKLGDTDFELDDELVGHLQEGDHIAVYF